MTIPQTAVADAMTHGFAGLVVDTSPKNVQSFVNEEATAEIAFGIMVQQGTLDTDCLIFTAITEVPVGITVHSHAYAKPQEVGLEGIKPNMTVGILRQGVIWVLVEEAVTPVSLPLVRCVPTGVEIAGSFRDSADATDLLDCSAFSRFLNTTSGAGIVKLEIDMVNWIADPLD